MLMYTLLGDNMLILTTGTVNSYKTDILNQTYTYNEGMKPIIYYPASCNKNKHTYIKPNNSICKSVKVFNIDDLYNTFAEYNMVLIDEVQFICTRQYISEFLDFLELCDNLGKTVHMFGLNLDYLGEPFEIITRILPYMDKTNFYTTKCECGRQANMNIRLINNEPDTNINSDTLMLESDNITYKAVCRDCFRKYTGLKALR